MKTQQSPKGLLDSFAGLMRKNMLSGVSSDRYVSSHPAPQERIGFLQTAAKESPSSTRRTRPSSSFVTIWPAPRSRLTTAGGSGPTHVRAET